MPRQATIFTGCPLSSLKVPSVSHLSPVSLSSKRGVGCLLAERLGVGEKPQGEVVASKCVGFLGPEPSLIQQDPGGHKADSTVLLLVEK